MTTVAAHPNGLGPNPQVQVEKPLAGAANNARIILPDKTSRILCIADIRGDYHELNRLIREHNATAVIHTGDFGFLTAESLDRMGDKILRHLLTYSPLIPPATRQQLLAIPPSAGRQALINALNSSSVHFPLSQFPHLLSGAITFPVPVFTVWGLIEDVRVMEKFRTGEYQVHNLSVIDEATSKLLHVSGLKLRLFGLGGAVAMHKLFDNGDGAGTIPGGQGTMWLTALQIGELVDTAQRVADPTETRLFIASAPISRWGLLEQTALAIKADLTISAGLHFRYCSSYNEYAVHGDFAEYQNKIVQARDAFTEVYGAVKSKVEENMPPAQQDLLRKAVETCQHVPKDGDESWTSTWHWVLCDASCGHMTLSVTDGRVSAEAKSAGLTFEHRTAGQAGPPNGAGAVAAGPKSALPAAAPAAPKQSALPPRSNAPPAPAGIPLKPAAATTPAPANNARGVPQKPVQPPTGPRATNAAPAQPSGPAAAGSSVPPKPVTTQPTRQPKGPTSSATPNTGANGVKQDAKPAQTSARNTPASKAPTPAPGSRNSPAPGNKADKTNAKANDKTEAPAADAAKPDQKTDTAADKHGDDQVSPTGPTQARSNEKRSLYLKKLPIPTSEDEIKALFPSKKDKITFVKIPYDSFKQQQKEFAFVDFETEADAKEALENHEEKIRDTAVIVVPSNPPTRNSTDFGRGGRGGGGRGSSFRGRGSGRFPSTSGGPRGDKPAGQSDKKDAAPAPAPAAKKD